MITVNVAQAKAHLSELLDKVEAGEDLIITRHGREVARVLRYHAQNNNCRSI